MNELKMAVRQLLRTPGFTILALIILGLGIGANTAMFSLINVLLFKPLSIERPDEVVRVRSRSLKPGEGHRSFSYPNFIEVRSQNDVFRDLTAFAVSMVGLTEGETTRRVFAVSVAANYFSTFAARPVLGRGFLPEEERPGAGLAVAPEGFSGTSVLLSLLGGVVALLLSNWVTVLMIGKFASKIPFLTIVYDGRLDLRVLAATFAFCLIATLVATLAPALRLSKVDVMRDLKEQAGEGGHAGHIRKWLSLRSLLVTGQVALSFVLLMAAGLFYRGAANAAEANPGFRLEQGVVVELDSSLASSIPFGMFSDGRQVGRPGTRQALDEGVELSEADRPVYANYTLITDDYFQSLGTSILRGREFYSQEAEGSAIARVAIVNEAVAEKLWPGEEAVGRQLELLDGRAGAEPIVVEVVGVAPGFKAAIGDQEASPYLYLPLGQAFQSMLNLHVRLAQPDLAAAGVYGVKSFVVARRTREIGIRMALGATTGQVLWMILREGMRLTAFGLALGCVLALGAGQLLRGMLFGVSAADPVSLGVALVVLTVASLAASYLPDRRAAGIQPMRALHCE